MKESNSVKVNKACELVDQATQLIKSIAEMNADEVAALNTAVSIIERAIWAKSGSD